MRPLLALLTLALAAALLAAPPRSESGAFTVGVEGTTPTSAPDLATALARARALRQSAPSRAIVVTLPAGLTRLAAPISLDAQDAGTAASPLILRAAPGGSTLSGAQVTGPAGTSLPALPPLVAHRQGDTTVPDDGGWYQGATRLALSAWPARGYASGWQGRQTPEGLLLRPPAGAPPVTGPVLVEGYFAQDWAFEASPARPTADGLLLPGFTPADALQPGARLRLRGLPAALAPGRTALAGGGAILRPLPGAPLEQAIAPSLLTVTGAAHVRIEGVRFEKTRGTAITVRDSRDVAFQRCAIAHTGDAGIQVVGGARVTLDRCTIDDTGSYAAQVFGGDRLHLIAAGHAITASTITRPARLLPPTPAIVLWGVGNRAEGNRILSTPHSAIALAGNEQRVIGNEIGWTVCETADAGAIYMGRDWTQRGMLVRGNYIHDVGGGRPGVLASGVYLDDQFSGAAIIRNVFFRMPFAVTLGGGRDTTISGNLFAVTDNAAINYDSRGTMEQAAFAGEGGILRQSLAAMPLSEPAWRTRYPMLERLLADRPGEPVGNRLDGNRYIQSQRVWSRPTSLVLPETDGRGVIPPQSDWTVFNGPDRLAAWRILVRVLGATGAPPWSAAPATFVSGCPD